MRIYHKKDSAQPKNEATGIGLQAETGISLLLKFVYTLYIDVATCTSR